MLFIAGADPNLNFNFNSSRVDPMATIGYDITEGINTYVKWSRAYRAGGANTRSRLMSAGFILRASADRASHRSGRRTD